MNEKSIVGRQFKFNSKSIKITSQSPTGVSFEYSDSKQNNKGEMSWAQFNKSVLGHKMESKAAQVLAIFQEAGVIDPPKPDVPQSNAVDNFDLPFKHNDRDAMASFDILGKGSPNKTTSSHYEPGEAADLQFKAAYYEDDNSEITDLTPENIEALTTEAEEKYAEQEANRDPSDDDYDRHGDR